jgi:NADH:ubiquinone oxidoreductase subunit 3 (subunit A)
MLLALLLGVVFLALGVAASKLISLSREFIAPLECGFTTVGETRQAFSLRFFVFAVVFVIFDVELVLVLPVLASKFHILSLRSFFILVVNLLGLGLFLE